MSIYRLHPQFPMNFGELIVDSFAGGGGASTGIELALGRPVDVAINHDPEAIALHTVNHPHTRHYCESVWDVDPREVTRGRPVGLAWFSPDCRHFSKAKGGQPVSPRVRGLAWVALRWAATVRPRVIMLENVEEFQTWGPLVRDEDGNHRPCPKRKGQTFEAFKNALRRHGYQVEHRELRACDYGAPTIRKRLFLIARCDGQPIVWPEPTHGPGRLPYRTAAECIDWSIPCRSIFERKRPLADATCRRIAQGIMRYVVNTAEPFIVPITNFNGRNTVHSINEPLRTITAYPKGGSFAIVTPVLAGCGGRAGQSRPRAGNESLATVTSKADTALVTAFLAKHYTGVVGTDLLDPMHTITSVDHHALVTSHMVKLRGTNIGHAMPEPTHTITANGNHLGEVRAFLVKYYSEGGQWQGLRESMHTIPTKDRIGLVMVHCEPYRIVDIGMRMLAPHELYRAQGFPANYIIDRLADGTRLSKAAQVRMCGNSVCPPMAAALVRANMNQQIEREAA